MCPVDTACGETFVLRPDAAFGAASGKSGEEGRVKKKKKKASVELLRSLLW